MSRKNIIGRLIKTGKKVVRQGLVVAKGGNISARAGDYMYIKTKGSMLDSPRIHDYTRVNIKTLECTGGVPSSEKYVHLACYKERDDIRAVLHLHPVFCTAVANSKLKVKPVSYELLASLGSEIAKASYKPAGSRKLASEIAAKIKKSNAVLMPNHGVVVVAKDLETALERALVVERACQTLVFSRMLGLPGFLPKKEARRIISLYKDQK